MAVVTEEVPLLQGPHLDLIVGGWVLNVLRDVLPAPDVDRSVLGDGVNLETEEKIDVTIGFTSRGEGERKITPRKSVAK